MGSPCQYVSPNRVCDMGISRGKPTIELDKVSSRQYDLCYHSSEQLADRQLEKVLLTQ